MDGIDASGFFAGLGGAAMVQSAILLMARRWLGRVDAMEADLRELREKEMGGVKNQITTAAISRKSIHEKIAEIERDMVKRGDIEQIHNNYVAQVRAMAEVATKIEHVSRHMDQQMERITSVTADVNRLIGRMEDK